MDGHTPCAPGLFFVLLAVASCGAPSAPDAGDGRAPLDGGMRDAPATPDAPSPSDALADTVADVLARPFALRVDCGATVGHTDAAGNAWVADVGAVGASMTVDRGPIDVTSTSDPWIYRTERCGMTGYTLPVPAGTYRVRLQLDEKNYSGPSQRLMDVTVEGQALPHLDVLVAAGGARAARVEEFRGIEVSDGTLTIGFSSATGGTMVNGIEVLPEPARTPATMLDVYSAPAGTVPSPDYAVTVDGRPLFVYPARGATVAGPQFPGDITMPPASENISFGYFDFAGEVTVEITPHRSFTSVHVRPSWRGVTPRIIGGHIFLTLTEPRSLVVELDGSWHQPLHLFANPPDAPPSRTDPNVTYFGPGEQTINADPTDIRPMQVASGHTVYIAGGAVVHGSIYASTPGVHDVTIRGRGILDGSAIRTHGTWGMGLVGVDGATIEGIIERDSPSTGLWVEESQRVTVRNVHMLNYRQNTDSIDLISVQSTLIDGSFLRGFDDAISVKARDRAFNCNCSATCTGTTTANVCTCPDGPDTDGVTVHGTTVWTDWGFGGLDVGAELYAPHVRNVAFSDCDVLHPNSNGICINNSTDGTVSAVSFADVRVEDVRRGEDLARFEVVRDNFSHCTAVRGHIDGVTVRDLRLLNGAAARTTVLGFDSTHQVANVSFAGIWRLGTHATTAAAAGLVTNAFAPNVTFAP